MKRDTVYYVMPMGEVWLLRAIGSRAEAYPTIEDALAAAERLSAKGAQVRVLSKAEHSIHLAPLAKAPVEPTAPRTRTATS